MKTIIKINDRHDTSIENVFHMLRPILEELELIGKIIPATELAQICRSRKSRLPLRSYNSLRIAEQIGFLGHGGSFSVGDLAISAYMEFDPRTRRRKPLIGIERAWINKDARNSAMKSAQAEILTNESCSFDIYENVNQPSNSQ